MVQQDQSQQVMVNPVAQVPQVSQPMTVTPVAQVPQVSQPMTVTPVAQVPHVSQMLCYNRRFLPLLQYNRYQCKQQYHSSYKYRTRVSWPVFCNSCPGGGSRHQAPKIWKYHVSYLIHIVTNSYLLLKVMHYESNAT